MESKLGIRYLLKSNLNSPDWFWPIHRVNKYEEKKQEVKTEIEEIEKLKKQGFKSRFFEDRQIELLELFRFYMDEELKNKIKFEELLEETYDKFKKVHNQKLKLKFETPYREVKPLSDEEAINQLTEILNEDTEKDS